MFMQNAMDYVISKGGNVKCDKNDITVYIFYFVLVEDFVGGITKNHFTVVEFE